MSRSALGLAPLEFVTRDQAQSQLARAAVASAGRQLGRPMPS